MPVFKPKIKQITDNEQPVARLLDMVQKFNDFLFSLMIVWATGRSQVGVRKKKILRHLLD